MLPDLFRLHRLSLEGKNAGDDLEAVRNTVRAFRSIERPSDPGKVPLDLVGFHHGLLRQDGFQQHAQFGDVPPAAAQIIDRTALDLVRFESEGSIETAARGNDTQAVVQDKQRFTDRFHNGFGQRVSVLNAGKGACV